VVSPVDVRARLRGRLLERPRGDEQPGLCGTEDHRIRLQGQSVQQTRLRRFETYTVFLPFWHRQCLSCLEEYS
jgi:hypothetical protein